MTNVILLRIIGITGVLFVMGAYYLLWISPDTELSDVIRRTRYAIVLNLSGGLMVIFYLYRR